MGFTSDGSKELSISINAEDEGASEAFGGVEQSALDMKTAVAGAGAVLAGAGVAGLAGATQAAADFEQQMVEVEKVTSPETAEEMSDSIKELSETIPLAQKELANIAAEAGRFGVEGSENIEDFTESVSKMSIATDLSATQAGEAFAKLSTLTGTPIDSMENLGSSINALSNNFATSSQEIVDSMMRSAGALSNLGLENTQISALSASLNEVSESSERAGTRLRRVAQELTNPKKVGKIASAFGVTVEEFKKMRDENPADVIEEMAEMMGEGGEEADALKNALSTTSRQALTGLSQNLDGLNSAMEESSDSFDENTSLQEEFEAATSTLNSRIQTLKNRLRNVAIEIGNQIIPYVNKALDAVVPLIDRLAEFNAKLDGLPGVIALVGAALTGLGAVAVAVGPAIVGALSPILVPVLAITAAVGALWYAWQNNFANIRGHVKTTISILRDVFASGSDEMNHLRSIVEKLKDGFVVAMNAVEKVLNFVLKNFTIPLIKDLAKIWKNNFSDIASESEKTMNLISKRVTQVLNFLKAFWDKWGDELTTVATMILDGLRVLFKTVFRLLATIVKATLALMRGDFSAVFKYIKQFVTKTLNDLVSYWKGPFLDGIKAALSMLWQEITFVFGGIWDSIKNAITGAYKSVVRWLSNTATYVKTTFTNAMKTAWNRIKRFIINTWKSIKTSVTTTITALISGAKARIRRFKARLSTLITSIKSTITGAFADAKRRVISTIKTLISDTKGRIKSYKTRISKFVSSIKSTITGAFTDAKTRVTTTITNLIADTKSSFNALVTFFKETFSLSALTNTFWDAVDGIADAFSALDFGPLEGALDTISVGVDDLISSLNDLSGVDIDVDVPSFDSLLDEAKDLVDVGGNNSSSNSSSSSSSDSSNDSPDLEDDPAGHNSDTRNDLVDDGNVVGLATGGIVDSEMLAMIGEAGQEAVIPLDKLSSYLDTAFAGGVATQAQAQPVSTGSPRTQSVEHTVEARLSVEGDDELARMIRDNAEIVVDERESDKQDRISRL